VHLPPSPPAASAIAAALTSTDADIIALAQVDDIRGAISQCEDGLVDRLYKRYGPSMTASGKRGQADPYWTHIKVKVTCRQRVFEQLTQDFSGDKDKFYAFLAEAEDHRMPSRNPSDGDLPRLVPFRLFAEAIPHRNRDLKEERSKEEYLAEDGTFSRAHWDAKWDGANDWEVWRALGKEVY